MGLLDSNIIRSYGYLKERAVLLSNDTSAFSVDNTVIDCSKFNTAIVEIVTYGGGVKLKFDGIPLSGTRSTSSFDEGIYAYEKGELKDISSFDTVRTTFPRLLVVDVRHLSKLRVGRDDSTTYGVDLKYALIQETIDTALLYTANNSIENIFKSVQSEKRYTFNINGYSGPGNKVVDVPEWANYAIVEFDNLGSSVARLYAIDKEHEEFNILTPSNFNVYGYSLKNSTYVNMNSFVGDVAFYVKGMLQISIASIYSPYFNNVTCSITFCKEVSSFLEEKIGIGSTSKNLTKNAAIYNVYKDEKISIYKSDYDVIGWISSAYQNIFTSFSVNTVFIYLNGLDSEPQKVTLNSDNFPGLINGSHIVRCIIVPATEVDRYAWRINVITDKGQIFHNFPQRGPLETWPRNGEDALLFEESAIWELKGRKAPVKTETGDNAILINTGCYKYNPLLPESSYEFHPKLNTDSSFIDIYNNGGFGATITKTNELGEEVTLGRFYLPARDDDQDNSFDFMGGFAPDRKMSLIGTYRSNTSKQVRTCVFSSIDGGRNWYCIYEFGSHGEIVLSSGSIIGNPSFKARALSNASMSSLGSGKLTVQKRSSIVPGADDKEPANLFLYGSEIGVSSIVPSASNVRVTTASDHNLKDGDIVVFSKVGTESTDWDFLTCGEHNGTSAGDGTKFCVKTINSTTFDLYEDYYNPFNPLPCRHIHSVDRNKDSFIISCGEMYPFGWIVWMDCWQSDSFTRIKPWDNLKFTRLTSTSTSILRTLGTYIMQDNDNTVYVGIDNEYNIMQASLPEGRTVTLNRSSNGVWKGKLVDIDNQNNFTCILPSKEVAYLFKIINGIMIYIGQLGEISVSTDYGENWDIANISVVDVSRYGGVSIDNIIVIQGYMIKVNK